MKEINLVMDSAIVYGWVKVALVEERIPTRGAAEIIIKRKMCEEFNPRIFVTLLPTLNNKADVLGRVKKGWLVRGRSYDER